MDMSRSILRNSLVLGLFAIATVGLVALTRLGTVERIAASERAAQVKALGEILPAGSYDNDLLADSLQLTDPLLGSASALNAWRARQGGAVNAVIFEAVAPDGYSGSIRLLVGVQADGRIAGVRPLSHRETPGLGDKIEPAKSRWILSFNGRSLDNPAAEGWAVKKDKGEFDQFAGATITPRAVVKAVHQTLQYFDTHRAELLGTSEEQAR